MKIDDAHEWNFKAFSACDAILKGRQICKEHGFKFARDVIEWDFIRV
jgi:hypothetical protein